MQFFRFVKRLPEWALPRDQYAPFHWKTGYSDLSRRLHWRAWCAQGSKNAFLATMALPRSLPMHPGPPPNTLLASTQCLNDQRSAARPPTSSSAMKGSLNRHRAWCRGDGCVCYACVSGEAEVRRNDIPRLIDILPESLHRVLSFLDASSKRTWRLCFWTSPQRLGRTCQTWRRSYSRGQRSRLSRARKRLSSCW